jgi:glycosyltransferase involved in cell wall biosynthesis
MKIYSLTTTYPESESSTKPRFVHALNMEFANFGIKTIVICPHIKGSKTKFEMDSVEIKFFKYLPEKFEINHQSIPDVIKSISGKIKVSIMIFVFFFYSLKVCLKDKDYIFHGHWAFPSGFLTYILAKILRKKFIVTVHGSEISLLQRFSILKKLTVNGLNQSLKVFASNQYLQNKLIEMGVDKGKITLVRPIPNFIDHKYEKTELDEFKKILAKIDDKIILYVGRLTEVKGVEFLIRAIPDIKHKDIHLIIAGDGILFEKLNNIAKSIGMMNQITFFGPANLEQLAKIYGIADVFVLPSIITDNGATEGTGLVIPEAMYFGIPVIASSVGGITETVKNEYNGLLVKQKDSKEIALAIERILSDMELKDNIVKNARETVKEFLPSTVAQKYFEVFQKVI